MGNSIDISIKNVFSFDASIITLLLQSGNYALLQVLLHQGLLYQVLFHSWFAHQGLLHQVQVLLHQGFVHSTRYTCTPPAAPYKASLLEQTKNLEKSKKDMNNFCHDLKKYTVKSKCILLPFGQNIGIEWHLCKLLGVIFASYVANA